MRRSSEVRALLSRMGGWSIAIWLLFCSVLSVQIGLVRPSALWGGSRLEGGLCWEADNLKGRVLPSPKLTVTPIAQDSPIAHVWPDLEYLPIYPGPIVQHKDPDSIEAREGTPEHVSLRHFWYETSASYDEVIAFYETALSEHGWALVARARHKGFTADYSWTDPEDRTPWHFRLKLDIARPNLPNSDQRTFVTLEYGRYPDIFKNLLLYPGATGIQTTCYDTDGGDFPTSVFSKSYLTTASAEEVTKFYRRILPEHGWRDMPVLLKNEWFDTSPREGLEYLGDATYTERGLLRIPTLNITTARQWNGMTRVQMYVRIEQRFPAAPTDSGG
jgi:hypothetical protein